MSDELYQPGISFRNPRVVRPATGDRTQPWFYQETVPGPLSMKAKLKRWERKPNLTRYSAVWNRAAKQRNVEKLGAYFHDVPTVQELGAAPAPTKESTTTRSPLGFLENLISTGVDVASGVTNVIEQREAQKQREATAKLQTYQQYFPNFGSDNTLLWVLGLGAVGVGAYFLIGRR